MNWTDISLRTMLNVKGHVLTNVGKRPIRPWETYSLLSSDSHGNVTEIH